MAEISKMLTISTVHVSESVMEGLMDETWREESDLSIFPKGEYGVFIHVPEKIYIRDAYHKEQTISAPPNLAGCLDYARGKGCDWLCLDRNGEVCEDLPVVSGQVVEITYKKKMRVSVEKYVTHEQLISLKCGNNPFEAEMERELVNVLYDYCVTDSDGEEIVPWTN